MPSLFTQMISGELPRVIVHEDEFCLALMAPEPVRTGHTLLIPRQEIDYWADCPPQLWSHLTTTAQRLALAIHAAYKPVKVSVVIAGIQIRHLHIHLIPIDKVPDIDFSKARKDVPLSELDSAASLIRNEIKAGRM